MNKGLNECLEFSFELNTEVNDFFSVIQWLNEQSKSIAQGYVNETGWDVNSIQNYDLFWLLSSVRQAD